MININARYNKGKQIVHDVKKEYMVGANMLYVEEDDD